ncbi:MAG: TatD DNase family protein [Verrucomicrobiales bacterium]
MSEVMRWIDNHCHIPPGADGDLWVEAARAAGVDQMVTVGVTHERSVEAIAVAARHDGVFATVGVHPHDATEGTDGLSELLAEAKVVAVGEAGLDYHYDYSPRDIQRTVFAEHIALANDHGLPLVIHTRDAWQETFDILDVEGVPERTVFHCFTGGPEEAKLGLDRNIIVSVSGIVTFKTAEDLREAVAICPIDRLMVETDSPYLAPVPHRGKKNQPANVVHVGEAVADILGVSVAELAEATSARATKFYGLSSR